MWFINSISIFFLNSQNVFGFVCQNSRFDLQYCTQKNISLFQKLFFVGIFAIFAVANGDVSHILHDAHLINGLSDDSRQYLPPVQSQQPKFSQVISDYSYCFTEKILMLVDLNISQQEELELPVAPVLSVAIINNGLSGATSAEAAVDTIPASPPLIRSDIETDEQIIVRLSN